VWKPSTAQVFIFDVQGLVSRFLFLMLYSYNVI
jgi:hypothetical protein